MGKAFQISLQVKKPKYPLNAFPGLLKGYGLNRVSLEIGFYAHYCN